MTTASSQLQDLLDWVRFGGAVATAYVNDLVAAAEGKPLPDVNDLYALIPPFRKRIEALMADAARQGKPLRADSTFRTYSNQAQKYADFKAGKGARAAPPGLSRHEQGRAADLWPIGVPYEDDARAAAILDSLKPTAALYGLKNLSELDDHDHWEDAA